MAFFEEKRVADALALCAGAGLTLVVYGFAEHPQASLLSVAAATAILVGYGAVGLTLKSLTSPADLRASSIAGAAAGVVFAAEVLLEYFYLPPNNVIWGYAEFGMVFLIYALVAGWVAWRGQPVGDAVRVAMVAAVISSMIWCLVLLSVFYTYEGTSTQTAVLIAEGDPEDFLRSGMTDYRTFLIEDLFGATFFHLLLGPIIAALLGLISSLPIVWSRRLLLHSS
jgi:hypothetical protein